MFYKVYYTTIALRHEARFIVPVRTGDWIHVLVERERPGPKFSEPGKRRCVKCHR